MGALFVGACGGDGALPQSLLSRPAVAAICAAVYAMPVEKAGWPDHAGRPIGPAALAC